MFTIIKVTFTNLKLIQNGCTLQEVQEILGHRSFQTTLKYAHLHPGKLNEKAKKIMDKTGVPEFTQDLVEY